MRKKKPKFKIGDLIVNKHDPDSTRVIFDVGHSPLGEPCYRLCGSHANTSHWFSLIYVEETYELHELSNTPLWKSLS